MASDDSRLQELLNMQNTANMPTNPTPDQPTGQFSGDDLEFESFMFDTGTGPLTSASMVGTEASASTQVYPPPVAPAPSFQTIQPLQAASTPTTPTTPGAFEITGQEVPTPSYLRTAEPQQEQQEQPLHIPMPRATGPLGGLHSTSNLSARLAQLQAEPQAGDAPSSSSAPATHGTGPLSRRGTGPLGGVTPGRTGTEYTAAQQPAAPQGPINPAYFKTPTGPLNKPASESSSASIPRISSTGPLNSTLLRPAIENASTGHSPNSQPWQASPTTWSDSALTAIEDFSAVLLAMHATRPSTVSLLPTMSARTATTYETPAEAPPVQEGKNWSVRPLESTSSVSSMPALEEPPVFEPLPTQVAQPGWGEMTGAPPANDYSGNYDQLATPDYTGPEMGYAVPLEVAPVAAPEQESNSYAEMQVQAQEPIHELAQQPEQEAYAEQSSESEPVLQVAQEDAHTYNSINPDDLQFEGFMFNEGAQAATQDGTSLPDIEEFRSPVAAETSFEEPAAALALGTEYEPSTQYEPAVETQDYSIEEPAPFDSALAWEPVTQATQSEPQVVQAVPEAQENPKVAGSTEQGPLPFWLQDTSDLEAIAKQGYLNVNTGLGQPTADMPLAMQSAAPLEAPVFETPPMQMPELAQMREAVAPEATLPDEVDTYSHTPFDAPTFEPTEYASTTPTDTYTELESPAPYEDLPPIEPFDFSSLGLVPEEEELGFNTEELTGMMPSRHDPMRATADLDVLADIFDGSPVGSPLDVRPAFLTTSPFTGLPLAGTDTESAVEEDLSAMQQTGQAGEAPAYPRSNNSSLLTSPIASFLLPSSDDEPEEQTAPAPLTGKEESRASGGWTSMVTTALSMDATDIYEQQREASMLAEPAAASIGVESDMDLNIEPFDYKQLDLDQEQEMPTGMLNSGKERKSSSGSTGQLFMPGTGDLVMPELQVPATDAASPWTESTTEAEGVEDEDEDSWKGTERDTSLFMSTQPRLNRQGKSSRSTNSTRWLTDDGVPGAAAQEAPERENVADTVRQQAVVDTSDAQSMEADGDRGELKARVSWTDPAEPKLPIFATDTNLSALNMTSDVEGAAPTPRKQGPGAISRALFASEVDDFVEGNQQPAAHVEQPQAVVQHEEPAPAEVPTHAPTPARGKASSPKTSARTKAAATTSADTSAPAKTPPLAPAATPVIPAAPAEPVYSYQPMQGYEAEAGPVIEMPKVGAIRDIYTSGPLPELEGFDQLRMMVDNNPDDIGAHMALASAYTQLGDPDTALRVYRRVLKKRTVSATILRLITEELNEFEAELEGNARYHQVRGDLYTRQGRNQEAIREYNKIV